MNDEFYLGYLDRCPPRLARRTRLVVVALALLAAGVAASCAWLQAPATPGRFEFGTRRTYEGTLREWPLPTLRIRGTGGTVTDHLLVGFGKHGLPDFARGHEGHRVRFDGTLIQSGNTTMIEMNAPESFRDLGLPNEEPTGGSSAPPPVDLGFHSLVGELVDTKCYLGVMRPAVGKVHRACAARCLSGGVPPGLLLRTQDGNATVVLLATPAARASLIDPQWAGRNLRVHGRLVIEAGLARLETTTVELAD